MSITANIIEDEEVTKAEKGLSEAIEFNTKEFENSFSRSHEKSISPEDLSRYMENAKPLDLESFAHAQNKRAKSVMSQDDYDPNDPIFANFQKRNTQFLTAFQEHQTKKGQPLFGQLEKNMNASISLKWNERKKSHHLPLFTGAEVNENVDEKYRDRSMLANYLAETMANESGENPPYEHVAENWDVFRSRMWTAYEMEGEPNDKALKDHIQKQMVDGENLEKLDDRVVKLAQRMASLGKRGTMDDALLSDLIDQEGYDKKNAPQYRKLYRNAYRAQTREFKEVGTLSMQILDALAKDDDVDLNLEDGRERSSENVGALIKKLSMLPRGEREQAIYLMHVNSEELSTKQSGFFDGVGTNIGRGGNDFASNILNKMSSMGTLNRNYTGNKDGVETVEQWNKFRAENEEKYRFKINDNDLSFTYQDGFKQTDEAEEAMQKVRDYRSQISDRNQTELHQDLRNVRNIIKKVEAENQDRLSGKMLQGVYDASYSLPQMAALAVPGGLALSYANFSEENDIRLRQQYPDMSESERQMISNVAALPQAFIERMQVRTLFKGTPKTSAFIQKLGANGVVASFIGRATIGTGKEFLQERAQDAMLPIIQKIAHNLEEDIPDVKADEWEKALTVWDEKTFFAVLPLAILGAGGSTAMDKMGAEVFRKHLANEDQLRLSGLTREEARLVSGMNEKGSINSHKEYQKIIEGKSDEEIQQLSNDAMADGALDRVLEKEIMENGTESQIKAYNDTKERNEEFDRLVQRENPVISEVDGGYELAYPEILNKPNTQFETKEEAEAEAIEAKDEAYTQHSERIQQYEAELEEARQQGATKSSDTDLQEVADHLETAVEGAVIKIDTGKSMTLADRVKQGTVALKDAMTRIAIYKRETGKEITLDSAVIKGENNLKRHAKGYISKLYKGSNVADVFEESAEGYMKNLVEHEGFTFSEFKDHIVGYQKDSGEILFPNIDAVEDQEVIEAFSKLSRAYVYNNRDHSTFPPALQGILNAFKHFFESVVNTAKNLVQLKNEGKLDGDLEHHLARAVGLDVDEINRIQQKKYDAELMAEIMPEEMELSNVMKGRIPRPVELAENESLRGEVQGLWDQLTKTDRNGRKQAQTASSYFASKGSGYTLSNALEYAREAGFNIETEADLLEAVESSLINDVNSYPDMAQLEHGGNFSIAQSKDPLIQKIRDHIRDPETKATVFRVMMARLQKVKAKQNAKLTKRLFDGDGEVSTYEELLDSIAQLDAIIAVLPKEIRGQIGGYKKLASLKTAKGRTNYLTRRIESVDGVLDKYVREEFIKSIDKLIKRAQPTKNKTDKVAKGKITPEGHDELKAIEAVLEMDEDALDKAVNAAYVLEGKALTEDDSKKSDAMRLEANTALVRLSTFGNLRNKKDPISARGAENAHSEIKHLIDNGRMRYQQKLLVQKEHRDSLKEKALKVITGGRGKKYREGRLKDGEKGNKVKWLKQEHSRNISFEMMLNGLSRLDKGSDTLNSWINQYFGEATHKATHAENRGSTQKKAEMLKMIAGVYGIDTGKIGWRMKVEKVMVELNERTTDSGIFIEEGGKEKKLKTYRDEIEAIIRGENTHIHDGYSWVKLTRSEIAEFKSLIDADTKKRKTNFEITRKTDGEINEQYMNQDSAMFLSMMYKQEGLQPAMQKHGYSDEVLKQIEDFLTPQAKLMRQWLFAKYDQNYDYFNDTFANMFGVNLPKVKNYSPARSVHAGRQAQDMLDAGHGKQSTTPGMAMERIKHMAEPRYDVGALSVYMQHVDSTEHFVNWAKPVAELRSVFMNKEVREAILDHHGEELYNELIERIDIFAEGGNSKAKTNRYFDHLRKTFTVAKLAFNWGVFIKQLTSLPAYSYDMPAGKFLQYEAEFFLNPVDNWRKMWSMDYTKQRFEEGYDRDVMAVLNSLQKKKSKLAKAAEFGMITGRAGDIMPVIVGGYAAYRHGKQSALDTGMNEEQAEARAILAFEMSTDRAQQSGNLKDQSAYGLGGSLNRILTMFQTSPRQYYANMSEAVQDAFAGREGGKKRAAKALFISHVILPSAFYWVSAYTRNLPKDEEDKEDMEKLLKGWVASMALGPLSGIFLWGQVANELSSGYGYRLPIIEFGSEAKDGIYKASKLLSDKDLAEITAQDVMEIADKLATSASLAIGGGATWYDIGSRFAKSIGIEGEDVKRAMMSEVEGQAHDYNEWKNKFFSDTKLETWEEGESKTKDRKKLEKENEKVRYAELVKQALEVKAKHPHIWQEILEKLDLPKDVLKKIEKT